jgi:hypothetical protein
MWYVHVLERCASVDPHCVSDARTRQTCLKLFIYVAGSQERRALDLKLSRNKQTLRQVLATSCTFLHRLVARKGVPISSMPLEALLGAHRTAEGDELEPVRTPPDNVQVRGSSLQPGSD